MKKLLLIGLVLLLGATTVKANWTYACPFDVNVNAGRGTTKAYLVWTEPQGIYDPCATHNIIVRSLPSWVTVNIVNNITPADMNAIYGFGYTAGKFYYIPDVNCVTSTVLVDPTMATFGFAQLTFDTNDLSHLGIYNGSSSDTCRGITHSSNIRLMIKPEAAIDNSGPFMCPVQYGR